MQHGTVLLASLYIVSHHASMLRLERGSHWSAVLEVRILLRVHEEAAAFRALHPIIRVKTLILVQMAIEKTVLVRAHQIS